MFGLTDFPPHTGITHYLGVDRFEQLVQSRCLYLRRQDLQEKDARDGLFPAASKEHLHAGDVALMRALNQSAESARALASNYQMGNDYMRQRHYLHCWTLRDDEHPEMWRMHGQQGRGVCIKTSIQRLRDSIGGDRFKGHHGGDFDLKLDGVVYTDESEPFPTWPSFLVAFRKVRVPGHVVEEEVRLLACDYKIENPVGPEGQLVPVKLDRLFHAVYLGAKIEGPEYERLERLANTAAGSRVVRPSAIRFD